MTLKNEIFEGIAAYKALTPTTQDQYYDEMYRQARKQREQEEKGERDEIAEAERKRAGTATAPPAAITPPTFSSTQTPGANTISGIPTVQGPVQGMFTDLPQTYRRGGRVPNVNVRRYADGGPVTHDPDNPIDDIVNSVLGPPDPRADLGPLAPRRPPQRPVNPPRPVDPDTEARIAAERAPNTRARQGALDVRPPSPSPTRAPSFEGSPVIDPEVEARIAAERAPNQRAREVPTQQFEGSPVIPPQPPAPPAAPPGGSVAAAQAPRTTIPPGGPMQPGGEPPPLSPRQQRTIAAQQAGRAEEQAFAAPVSPGGEPMPPPTRPDLSEAIAASGGSEAAVRTTPPPSPTARPAPGGPMQPGGEAEPEEETSSAFGRGARALLANPIAEKQYAIDQQIRAIDREIVNITPSVFAQTRPSERAATQARVEELQAQKAALVEERKMAGVLVEGEEQRTAALAPGATLPAPGKPPPPPAAAAPAAPTGGVYGKVPGPQAETGGEALVTNAPTPYPTKVPPAKGPNQVPVKTAPAQNGPATAGSTGPGGGQGAQPAPPRGAASQPYTTATAPKGSLGDQTRVTAFDPTADLYDSRNAQRVTEDYRSREATGAPTQLAPQDVQRTMQGIAQEMPNGPQVPGQNAASRPAYNRFVQAHNPTGKLEPGEAALVGMVGRYKVLLRQGRMKEAGQLAMGIMQAASLEAAVRGRQAVDLFKSGDTQGGKNLVMDGLSHTPDGRSHKLNPDGSITSYDSSGQPTGQTQMSGEQWLALAMGLSDGSLIWKSLQQTVAMLQTPDKDAEGRSLGNDLKRLQIQREQQRIAQGNAPRTGRAPAAPAPRSEAADAILGQK